MAQNKDQNIKSATGRKALEPRREPYWERLSQGVFIGYRAQESGKGTWIARMRDDGGGQKYHAIGTHADFDAAARVANAWVDSVMKGVEVFDAKVGDACATYLDWLKLNRAASTAKLVESCFARLVTGQTIARIPLEKLQTRHVRTWLNDQVDDDDDDDDALRRSKVTANRQLDSLKAALNMAMRDRLVSTDAGWRTVTRFEKVSRRRERLLTKDERTALLKHCDADMRAFCAALMLTGARPGEIAKCNLSDFDPEAGTLTVEGKTGRRTVALSTDAVALFKGVSKDRIGKQPLLIRDVPVVPPGIEGVEPSDPRSDFLIPRSLGMALRRSNQ